MRAYQHKCLPIHACINSQCHYYLKKIVVNSKMIPKFKKNFPLVCRACQVKSINIQHIEL